VKLKKHIACALGACAIVLMGGSIRPVSAQTAAAAGSTAALQHWNSANEISVTGTIHEVVNGSTSGLPPGVNLLLDDSQSFQYASLGSQLNSSTKSTLAAGQSIKLKGIVTNVNGQNLLVVRELTIGQQTTQIRNTKGMMSPRVEVSAYQGNRPRSKNASNGGAQ
jgi:NADH dehydrogenase FAD-containing subunit